MYELKIAILQSQPAEKDKELEQVKKSKTYIMNFGDKVKEVQVVDNNQDKIEFALEQLEKVKEKFGYKHNSQLVISSKQLVEFIDQQIALLKGNIEDD